jgi:ketosteroid isomerase-like protein
MTPAELTPTQRNNVALTRRAFQLYVGGDIEGLLELYDPDVVVGAPQFMNAGPFRGHDGYMEWLRIWNEAWETFDFDVRAVDPVGEGHVVATVLVSGRGAGSGIAVEQMSYWVGAVRNGLGTYLEVLADRDEAFELADRRESGE